MVSINRKRKKKKKTNRQRHFPHAQSCHPINHIHLFVNLVSFHPRSKERRIACEKHSLKSAAVYIIFVVVIINISLQAIN